ncbi:hypothetical protein qu_742 [Acanthamoeba polyphaga mimivirus]|nr:hypothetical protein [Mimivirus reunion]WMV62076.1 hypothetical protein qu_742 [Mimivirus sp.]WMV63053.1 hypothetical protein qu_742 [Acanthamoeba polyphaga mimivirus]WMV64030.1 hypothetical protein qu_742 [Mimivirus sp.]
MESIFFMIGFENQYQIGLVESSYDDNPDDYLTTNGLYFTNAKYISDYFNQGTTLFEIKLPIDDNEFKYIRTGDRWRANRLNLVKSYSLFDSETYNKFGLNITDNKYIMDFASSLGKIDFLDKTRSLKLSYTNKSLDEASINGHISVLNWWKHSGLKLKYTELSIDGASGRGHIDVLNWWLNLAIYSKIKFKYTQQAINSASKNGKTDSLEWWKRTRLPLIYTTEAIDAASMKRKINSLDWWLKSGLQIEYTVSSMDHASWNNHTDVLDWWLKSGLELKYSGNCNNWIDRFGRTDILDWWEKSGLKIKFKHEIY